MGTMGRFRERAAQAGLRMGWAALYLAALFLTGPSRLAQAAEPAECTAFRRSAITRERLGNLQLERRHFVHVGQWDAQQASWVANPQPLSPRARVYVVNLWAEYCTPCLRELPTLFSAVKEASLGRQADVQLVLLAEDTSADAMKGLLARSPLWPRDGYASDTGGAVRHGLGVETVLPVTVVLDRDLVVRYAVVGAIDDYGQLKEQIDRLLRLRR